MFIRLQPLIIWLSLFVPTESAISSADCTAAVSALGATSSSMYNTVCLIYFEGTSTLFTTAEANCGSFAAPYTGGTLAMGVTTGQLAAIDALSTQTYIHIGGFKSGGTWYWWSPRSGTATAAITSTMWYSSEPNGSGDVLYLCAGGKVCDQSPTISRPAYMCQIGDVIPTTTTTTTSTTPTTTSTATTTSTTVTTTTNTVAPGFFGVPDEAEPGSADVVATVSQPANMQDAASFTAQLTPIEKRIAASWPLKNFMWITYEGRLLDNSQDLVLSNDPGMGNCVTFNHVNASRSYVGRRPGRGNGFVVYIDVGQYDYVPWITSAGYKLVIHDRFASISSESPSYTVAPGFFTTIGVKKIEYDRLDKPYSQCVEDKSEVKSYYYPGNYSSNNCLRSCYQDELLKSKCGCMDPRFPTDPNAKTCALTERGCIDEFMRTNSDPTNWADCSCPLPCRSTDYFVSQSRAIFRDKHAKCGTNATCNSHINDNYVMVEVYLTSLNFLRFVERPSMTEVDFLSRMGGALGIVCGMSVISMVELIVILIRFLSCCCCSCFTEFVRRKKHTIIMYYKLCNAKHN